MRTMVLRYAIPLAAALAFLGGGCAKDPAVSKAAREREAVVKALPVADVGVAGLKLVSTTSDPGHRDGGNAATVGEDVEVTRSYQLSDGDPTTMCGDIVQAFADADFSFSQACEGVFAAGVLLKAARTCSNFNVKAQVQIYTADDPPFMKGKVLVVLRAPYPDSDTAGTCDGIN